MLMKELHMQWPLKNEYESYTYFLADPLTKLVHAADWGKEDPTALGTSSV